MNRAYPSRRPHRTWWVLLAVAAVTCVALPSASPRVAHAASALNGGGSSFAKLEIDQWRAEVARKPYEINVNYVAQGSSFGRQQYIEGNLEFAASDIPFTAAELQQLQGSQRANFAYVPVSAGGLGFMYNLIDGSGNRITNLNLTRRAVCRIFTEPNMLWSDPEIQGANPTIALPAQPVRPILRQDGSGTSYVLSEFCIAVAPDVWQAFMTARAGDTSLDPLFFQGQPISNWPSGWGTSGTALAADGVAAAVADSSGLYSITYNEAGFAKVKRFPNANVQNAAGAFTQPTEDAVSIALGYASGRTNGTFQLDFTGPAPEAYFPSTYSYVIAQTTGFAADRGQLLARFLCYAVTKGQRVDLTTNLGYARLSAPLVDIAKNAIAKIPGAPAWDQCAVSADPPPAAPTTVPVVATTVAPASGGANGSTGGTTPTTSIVVDPVTGSTVIVSAGTGTGSGTAAAPSGTPAGGGTGTGTGVGTGTGTGSGTGTGTGGAPVGSPTVSIDPVTGATVVVPAVASGDCVDPLTGLPADPTSCVAAVGDASVTDGQVASGAPVPGQVAAAVAPPAINPTLAQRGQGPDGTQVTWWLIQGGALCALGTALAGVRRAGRGAS